MIVDGRAVEASAVMQVAHLMALAARTAPKGRGADHIETVVVSGEDLQQLGEDVISYGEETGQPLYVRDGNCLQKCQALLIIGVKNVPMGLKNCGFFTLMIAPVRAIASTKSVWRARNAGN